MSEFFSGGKKHPDTAKQTRRANMRDERIALKRQESAERQALSDALSLEERVAKLDDKFGVGQGAVKERAKLAMKMEMKMAKTNKKTTTARTTDAAADQTVAMMTEALVGQIQAMVKDVGRIAKETVEEEMRKRNAKPRNTKPKMSKKA